MGHSRWGLGPGPILSLLPRPEGRLFFRWVGAVPDAKLDCCAAWRRCGWVTTWTYSIRMQHPHRVSSGPSSSECSASTQLCWTAGSWEQRGDDHHPRARPRGHGGSLYRPGDGPLSSAEDLRRHRSTCSIRSCLQRARAWGQRGVRGAAPWMAPTGEDRCRKWGSGEQVKTG